MEKTVIREEPAKEVMEQSAYQNQLYNAAHKGSFGKTLVKL